MKGERKKNQNRWHPVPSEKVAGSGVRFPLSFLLSFSFSLSPPEPTQKQRWQFDFHPPGPLTGSSKLAPFHPFTPPSLRFRFVHLFIVLFRCNIFSSFCFVLVLVTFVYKLIWPPFSSCHHPPIFHTPSCIAFALLCWSQVIFIRCGFSNIKLQA